MATKRHYKDWYSYETRQTSWLEAFWMIVFTVVLVIGFPLMFAAMFRYAVPLLFGLL
ncbi:MAG TPA: hypothetical protein PLJ27_16600 [Polyangiaceae bacterium]|nr:MAG: hypothetical protein BWY17_00802 [Deltaproteobacteria bacterium ADurb.Bin207]HNS96749.1 hypothetical protein [Polyangiaceae bacterium]HNZ20680.1 hypothetical protein [Polyangiaceae bacterium]HOD20704.1 hypothetical protein [Polyangiaceae bacterium]HOE47124.1 hypothetical protein [Polyangiaceae bacterium]